MANDSHKEIMALLASHQDHLLIANKEMGEVKKEIASMKYDIAVIKENMGWFREALENAKKTLEKFDNRTWTIIATIIAGTLISIAVSIFK